MTKQIKKNCRKCKYYKRYFTEYCSKQHSIIYHPQLECKYFKLAWFERLDLFFERFRKKIELTKNCKK